MSDNTVETKKVKQRRGFAAMDPLKQRAIASKGGKKAHEMGKGHRWDKVAASEAGRKGGQTSWERRKQTKPEAPAEEEVKVEESKG